MHNNDMHIDIIHVDGFNKYSACLADTKSL